MRYLRIYSTHSVQNTFYGRHEVPEDQSRRRRPPSKAMPAGTGGGSYTETDTNTQRQTNMRYLRIQVVLEGATGNAGGHRWGLIWTRLVRTCGMGSGLLFILLFKETPWCAHVVWVQGFVV